MSFFVQDEVRVVFSDGRTHYEDKIVEVVERRESNLVDIVANHYLEGFQKTTSMTLNLDKDWKRQWFLICIHKTDERVKALNSDFDTVIIASGNLIQFGMQTDQVVAIQSDVFVCANSFNGTGLVDNVFALDSDGKRIWKIHDSHYHTFGECSYDDGIDLASDKVVFAAGTFCGKHYVNVRTGERFASIEEIR